MSYDSSRGYTSAVSRWGDRIRALRRAKGLTQDDLAALVTEKGGAMDRFRLSKIETGENDNPELTTIRLLAEALQEDIGELFREPRPEEKAGHESKVGGQGRGLGIEDHLAAVIAHLGTLDAKARTDFVGAVTALLDALEHARPTAGAGSTPNDGS